MKELRTATNFSVATLVHSFTAMMFDCKWLKRWIIGKGSSKVRACSMGRWRRREAGGCLRPVQGGRSSGSLHKPRPKHFKISSGLQYLRSPPKPRVGVLALSLRDLQNRHVGHRWEITSSVWALRDAVLRTAEPQDAQLQPRTVGNCPATRRRSRWVCLHSKYRVVAEKAGRLIALIAYLSNSEEKPNIIYYFYSYSMAIETSQMVLVKVYPIRNGTPL